MKETMYKWTFARIGGVDQVVIRNGDDVAHLGGLDQKLWAVLAMPTKQYKLQETLEYLDADKDGKVRVPDILRAVGDLKSALSSLDLLFDRNDVISLDQIVGEGLQKAFLKAIEIIAGAGGASAEVFGAGRSAEQGKKYSINLEKVDKAIDFFDMMPFNGDGVVAPDSAEDAATKALIQILIDAGYSARDASGASGVDASCIEHFLSDARAYIEWAEVPLKQPGLVPIGEKSEEALSLFADIRSPVDEYFRRCQILAIADSKSAMNELEAAFSIILSRSVSSDSSELAQLPIALPNSQGILYLDKPLHPAYEKKIRALFDLLGPDPGGKTAISRAEWEEVTAEFTAYGAWMAAKPRTNVEALGVDALARIVAGDGCGKIAALIEKDKEMTAYAEQLVRLRSLILLKRDFLRILNNFVNLDDFYLKKHGAFQSGRLFLDGRELELCMDVLNPSVHATMAGLSSMYLIYCDLSQKDGRKKSIVAALTAGDADNIFVGRNGIFYDADNADWDAVITKIVIQPISIREAFFSPYKWLVRTIEDYSMKRAANAEAASMNKMKGLAETAVTAAGKPDAKIDQTTLPKKIDVGTVAAIGVALGSIGAMVTGILGMFFGMGVWMPVGLLGVMLLISGPSMILAYMKLRKRNIGPLLNAEGWAVNSRLKINVPFGGTLSHLAVLPPGSNRQITDPFAEKKKPWLLYIIILLLAALAIAYFSGWLNPLLGKG